jgi:argininosuccinate synthase
MREEFVAEYLWKLVRAGGVYEHKYLLGTSMARPLLAKKQVEVALRHRLRRAWRTAAPARATIRSASS